MKKLILLALIATPDLILSAAQSPKERWAAKVSELTEWLAQNARNDEPSIKNNSSAYDQTTKNVERLMRWGHLPDDEIARLQTTDDALEILSRYKTGIGSGEQRDKTIARVIRELINNDYLDPNATDQHPDDNSIDSSLKYNLLQFAVAGGYPITITVLVNAGANIKCLCPTHGLTLHDIRRAFGAMNNEILDDAIAEGLRRRENRLMPHWRPLEAALNSILPHVLVALIKAYHFVPLNPPKASNKAAIAPINVDEVD